MGGFVGVCVGEAIETGLVNLYPGPGMGAVIGVFVALASERGTSGRLRRIWSV
jgi:hypothetical protein